MREMGVASGVEIEPPKQSALLDATLGVEGVIAAGVPGAGGYDAVFAIVVEGREEAVEALWEEYHLQNTPSTRVTRMGVREDPGRGAAGAGLRLRKI